MGQALAKVAIDLAAVPLRVILLGISNQELNGKGESASYFRASMYTIKCPNQLSSRKKRLEYCMQINEMRNCDPHPTLQKTYVCDQISLTLVKRKVSPPYLQRQVRPEQIGIQYVRISLPEVCDLGTCCIFELASVPGICLVFQSFGGVILHV
jgi:hypothetical protein